MTLENKTMKILDFDQACAYYARNFIYYSFQNFPKILPIILLIITYYSHKILLTILHAVNSGVK